MEGGLTDANRQHCAEAAKPLLQAVETLTTFAASPDFASIPATISAKVTNSQCHADFVHNPVSCFWIVNQIFYLLSAACVKHILVL